MSRGCFTVVARFRRFEPGSPSPGVPRIGLRVLDHRRVDVEGMDRAVPDSGGGERERAADTADLQHVADVAGQGEFDQHRRWIEEPGPHRVVRHAAFARLHGYVVFTGLQTSSHSATTLYRSFAAGGGKDARQACDRMDSIEATGYDLAAQESCAVLCSV